MLKSKCCGAEVRKIAALKFDAIPITSWHCFLCGKELGVEEYDDVVEESKPDFYPVGTMGLLTPSLPVTEDSSDTQETLGFPANLTCKGCKWEEDREQWLSGYRLEEFSTLESLFFPICQSCKRHHLNLPDNYEAK